MPEDWSDQEVVTIVADYCSMLERQLRGEPVNKTAHRRALAPLLANRTEGSIEYKHRNISAILLESGIPCLRGYKPLYNYQGKLADAVLERLDSDRELIAAVEADFAAMPSSRIPSVDEILQSFVAPPKPEYDRRRTREQRSTPYALKVVRRGVNYIEREARNRALGLAGEEFALRLEQTRLAAAGHERLAAKVEHVSQSQGDGLGYDVLSYETDGRERLIEVKTTKHPIETPFFVSKNEVEVSDIEADHYHLYRIFDFQETAKVFTLPGPISMTCRLEATTYRAMVA